MNKLRTLFIMVLFFVLVASVSATWCDTDFAKRINVSVNNTGGGALTDYQVYVNLSANPINETSLRIYNATSCTLRPHWTENETGGNSYGVWINYSSIAVSTWTNNTAIYYEKTAASSTSDGTNTFGFFDDEFYGIDNLSFNVVNETYVESASSGIPDVATMPNGSILTVYEDWTGGAGAVNAQVLGRFSHDNGTTWGSSFVIEAGNASCGATEPSLLVVNDSRILLHYLEYWNLSYSKVHQKISTNNGGTWGSDTEITTPYKYNCHANPGIKMQDGTLIWPTTWTPDALLPAAEPGMWNASVLISTNNGDSWSLGGTVPAGGFGTNGEDEATVVELSNNSLYMLLRNSGQKLLETISTDKGGNWSTPTQTDMSTYILANLLRTSWNPNRILVAWDNHPSNRYPLVVASSVNDCVTFENTQTVKSSFACYPGMTVADDDYIVSVYWESSPDKIKSARFNEDSLFPSSKWDFNNLTTQSTIQKKAGTYSARLNDSSGTAFANIQGEFSAQTTGAAEFWQYPDIWGNSEGYAITLSPVHSDGFDWNPYTGAFFWFYIFNDGSLKWFNTVAWQELPTATDLPIQEWTKIKMIWNSTSDKCEVFINGTSKGEIDSTNPIGDVLDIRFGAGSALGTGYRCYIDNVFVRKYASPEPSSILGSEEQQGENPTLHIGNAINIQEDWGRNFNSNLSANVTSANASGVWMNFSNAEFTNTSLGWVNLTLNEWVNESHNVNAPVTNVSVNVYLNSTTAGATNDTDSFYYEITKRTNTAIMDSSATQNADTSETFYVNATCNEEYGDTFLGGANLLEDGVAIDTDTSVTNYVNFSHSESSVGVYNYTVRFYNLTHYDNTTTPTYSNVTVSEGGYIPPDPITLANTTGNFWVNHTWSMGTPGNITDSYNVSIGAVWYNTTTTTYYNDSGLSAHDWSNVTVWAFNSSGTSTLSSGSILDNVRIPNNPITVTVTQSYSKLETETVFISDTSSSDTDSDTPTYSCNRTDLFIDFSTVTGYGNWTTGTTDSGIYYVDIGVSDGWGSTDNKTLTITINDATPGIPIGAGRTMGNFWVNQTWVPNGASTDTYNVSVNLSWNNGSSNHHYNNTGLSPHSWSNFSVWAFNSTSGQLSGASYNWNQQLPNNIPVLSGLPDNTTDEDVNQTDIFDLDDYFSDVDGDIPTYQVESNNQSAYVSVTINASNNVSYTLVSGWNGTASVVINVTDGWGSEDNDTFLIIVNAASGPGDYTPPNPTTLQNTTGNYYVNYTWVMGVPGNITDSYNVSWNLTWYNGTLTTYMQKEVGASNWGNITVYAYNSSGNGTLSAGSLSDNVQAPVYTPGEYPPATPTSLANTTGNGWVNYTWASGGGANVTDSYNVSWNLTWHNTTLVAYVNDTVGEFRWANISVWAFNSSGNGSLSAGSVSSDTQAGGGTFTTSMGTTAYNLITYYGTSNGSAEQFGLDIGSVDYIAMYNGSFYTHTMGFSANNFTTYHGIGYYVYLNASGSATYQRNNISDVPYSTQLFNRWNTVGWTNATNTNAEGVATSIGSACKYTSTLNADGVTYTTHTVGFTSNNHAVEKGKGYWTWVNTGVNWGRNS